MAMRVRKCRKVHRTAVLPCDTCSHFLLLVVSALLLLAGQSVALTTCDSEFPSPLTADSTEFKKEPYANSLVHFE